TYQGQSVEFLRHDESGAVLLAGEDDLEHGVHIVYDPALVLVPAPTTRPAAVTSEGHMTVTNLATGAKRTEGRIVYKLEPQGEGDVDTPRGKYHTVTFRATRSMKLSAADVQAVITSHYAPGEGLVAEESTTQTRVLGF